jgi:protein ImuA
MNMTQHPLLGRRPARQAPQVGFLPGHPDLTMICGRVHEACGGARRTLALWLAGQMAGPVLWIAPDWGSDRLHADGMADWAEPGRFVFVQAQRAEDVLWAMEESLRAGAVPLTVADLPAPPGLTAVRRMHLAAEAGAAALGRAPLGLLLTPGDGGAQGVESRWHLAPDHGNARHGAWCLSRLRARTAPQQMWHVHRSPRQSPDRLQIKAA